MNVSKCKDRTNTKFIHFIGTGNNGDNDANINLFNQWK